MGRLLHFEGPNSLPLQPRIHNVALDVIYYAYYEPIRNACPIDFPPFGDSRVEKGSPLMPFSLVRRRTVWWPTLLGWASLLAFCCASICLWLFQGEQFLSRNQRLNPEVLVVEGWIGIEGIQAAAKEFSQGGYSFLVASGGMTSNRWNPTRDSYAQMAERELLRFGIAREKLIFAGSDGTESRRTFQSAVAVSRALQTRNIFPSTINVFTFGSHARRSQMVFAKVFRGKSKVGVISWVPPGYIEQPWWKSSERSDDLIKESVGYIYELLLNSGRGFGNETEPEAPGP